MYHKSMRAIIFHIVLTVLVVGVSFPASASSWCRSTVTPRVSVNTDTDRIKWVYTKSQKELNNQQIDTISPFGQGVITDVGGLMQGGIEMAETMRFNTLTNPNTNEICMFYNDVKISFHIYPTVYIASEHPRGSCMHNAIRNHEMKHINTDRDIVNRYAQAVGNAVQAEIQKQSVYGPYPLSQEAALKNHMKTTLENILRRYSAKMDTERRRLQQAIDTREEYEAVQRSCRDRGF